MVPGALLGGKYRLIGEGAMGSVWAAVNELTHARVRAQAHLPPAVVSTLEVGVPALELPQGSTALNAHTSPGFVSGCSASSDVWSTSRTSR